PRAVAPDSGPRDPVSPDLVPPGLQPPDLTGFTGATAPGPALTGSVNLTMPLATWLGGSTAPGEVAGFGPVPDEDARALAALIAQQSGSRGGFTLTSKDGRPIGHGCARASPLGAGPDDQKRPVGGSRAGPTEGWALTVTIRPLAAGDCLHERESAGYRPSPAL